MTTLPEGKKDLSRTFWEFSRQNRLIETSDRILVAFSGGKDSVCLLYLLHTLKEKMKIDLAACHVHHGIRGEEADGDLAFCREFCETRGIPFLEERACVPAFCREKGLGLEEGARILRYEILEKTATAGGYTKIATAHTASDQAETILFHLIRGSGFAGASGIPPQRGRIIRPLLPFFQEEILSFLRENHLPFREDSSNRDLSYARNRIRHQILPEMEQIFPGARRSLVRFGQMSLWQSDLVRDLCDTWEEESGSNPETGSVSLCALSSLYKDRARYPVLYEVLSRMTKQTKIVIDFQHFCAVLSLLNQEKKGKIIEISQGFIFCLEKGNLVFRKNESARESISYRIRLYPGKNDLTDIGAFLTLSGKRSGKVENVHKNHLIIHAAFDKIEGDLFARAWQSGDALRIGNMTKSVRKLFQEAKIPAKDRPGVPLICDQKGIIWVPFAGLCDRVRESETDEVFTLSLEGEKLSGIEKSMERKM